MQTERQQKNAKGKHPKSETYTLYGESSTINFKVMGGKKVTITQEYDGNDKPKIIHKNTPLEPARWLWATFVAMGWLKDRDLEDQAGESAWYDQFSH